MIWRRVGSAIAFLGVIVLAVGIFRAAPWPVVWLSVLLLGAGALLQLVGRKQPGVTTETVTSTDTHFDMHEFTKEHPVYAFVVVPLVIAVGIFGFSMLKYTFDHSVGRAAVISLGWAGGWVGLSLVSVLGWRFLARGKAGVHGGRQAKD